MNRALGHLSGELGVVALPHVTRTTCCAVLAENGPRLTLSEAATPLVILLILCHLQLRAYPALGSANPICGSPCSPRNLTNMAHNAPGKRTGGDCYGGRLSTVSPLSRTCHLARLLALGTRACCPNPIL